MVIVIAVLKEHIRLERDLKKNALLQTREEKYMLYMKCICFSVQYKILSFPPEYFSFIKYSLKNCRVLDNYKTKLIERK